MKPMLDEATISYLFTRLIGRYGTQFTNKFSNISEDRDYGIAAAKMSWREDLGEFHDCPDALRWAYDNCPSDHAPNSLEFRDIARRRPRPDQPKLPPPPPNPEMAANTLREISMIIIDERDPVGWARAPKTQVALDHIVGLARVDARFAEVLRDLKREGICDQENRLCL